MNKTLLTIRIFFILLCICGSWLVAYTIKEWDPYRWLAMVIGLLLGVFVILIDILLKGFSLRGLTALTFGLAVGALIAYLLSASPLLEEGDPQVLFLSRLGLFVVCTYLATVIALRGKDEFSLVIPYVRFIPHEVDVPLAVVDSSALIDGRLGRIYETGFFNAALVIPRFVIQELNDIADSSDPARQARGRRGLETLNQLRRLKNGDIRIHESEVARRNEIDAKLVFLAQSMKAKLLTTDFNLAKTAEFHGVSWLNLQDLAKALHTPIAVGETFDVELVRGGKEENQAVGFLDDSSMVVVSSAKAYIGTRVTVEATSVVPSAGGKMIFARLLGPA